MTLDTGCPGARLEGLTLTGVWAGRDVVAQRVAATCLRGR
ncbi:hypothetical protein SAMN05443573_10425 [Celeribacter indicus]|nr:hypothetical protein SAMN05443573_10425 [Celeribacter indicus]